MFSIDANGVIYRVVTLFRGHKNLIQGFNAFLPRTHHIDPQVAETGILPAHIVASAVQAGLVSHSEAYPPIATYGSSAGAPPPRYAPPSNLPAASSATQSPSQPAPTQPPKKSTPQFNRAIGYVKKIKQRFASEPQVYKSFLAALHSYHREQRTIQEVI